MSAAELAAALADRDGAMTVLTDRVDATLLERCTRLKAVCNIAVGYNNFDLKALSAPGVLATNAPGVLDAATADFTWALILATARRLTEAWLRAAEWQGWALKQFLGMDVQGATFAAALIGSDPREPGSPVEGFSANDLFPLYYRVP